MKKIIITRTKPLFIKDSPLVKANEFFEKWLFPFKDEKTSSTNALLQEVIDTKAVYSEIFKEKMHLTQAQIIKVAITKFPKDAKKILFRYYDFVVIVKKENENFSFDLDRLEHSFPIKYDKGRVFYVIPEKIAS